MQSGLIRILYHIISPCIIVMQWFALWSILNLHIQNVCYVVTIIDANWVVSPKEILCLYWEQLDQLEKQEADCSRKI